MTRIRFEDLPSTNTPRNAENLNKLNNVVISSTEPTTGEEVWMQKGKNLFNKNSVVVGYLNEDGSIYPELSYSTSDFIPVTPNTTYYKTKTDSVRSKFYDKNKNPLTNNYNDLDGSGDFAFTTPENAYYLRVSMVAEYVDTLQIEQGSTGTTYEPYTRKIYTKNDNGGYEKFYDETNREVYSTSEQRIGTWIDGKTLYRRVYDCGNLGAAGTKETPTNLSNVNYVDWEGVALASGGGTAYPYKMAVTGNDYGVKAEIADNKIRIKTVVDLYDYTGYVTILYTKN